VLVGGVAIDLLTARGLSENLLYLLMAIPTGFGVVNVGAHAIHAKKSQPEAPSQTIDLAPITAQIKALEETLQSLNDSDNSTDYTPDLDAIKQQSIATAEILKGLTNAVHIVNSQAQATHKTILAALGQNTNS
jgi:predicted  nucleic acid-binding Zn-ribbon protein